MEINAKTRRPKKGEKPRNIRDQVDSMTLKAENDDEANVLSMLFRIVMDVSIQGFDLILQSGLEQIAEAKASNAAKAAKD